MKMKDITPKRGAQVPSAAPASANANVTCEIGLALLENVQRVQSASAELVIIYVLFENNFL